MDIRPFRGWTYAADDGDVSDRIAPPYDVLNAAQRDELLARHPRNIVAVDLPHFPPDSEGPKEAYDHAAWVLGEWKGRGDVLQADRPCLYAYSQQYTWAGRTYTRRAMIAGVRARELGEEIIPHEHTFAGPKADRLRLTEATRTQLSPIFGFYQDPQGQVANLLDAATGGEPNLHATLNGVEQRLWTIESEKTIGEIASLLRGVPAYIADGHHRYTTALNYCRRLRETGRIDGDHEANFVMFALVAADDPGLVVLPTHRVVCGLEANFELPALVERLGAFSWKRCSVEHADLRNADAFLEKYGPGAMALMGADPAEIWIGRLEDPRPMQEAAREESDAWRALDVAVLHKLILESALEPWRSDRTEIQYTPDGQAVLAACRSGRAQLGVCLRGTPLESVRTIADEGGSMPHKSTYFYPKLATGMVLKPLE
jgi:uncharacterized protein (DUF1015 family)